MGRQEQIGELHAHLEDGARLLTICGAPGLGKTRLARRLGSELLAAGASVAFCDLTSASTLGDVLRAVAQSLGVPAITGATTDESSAQLGEALAASGPITLLLDNFEHVVAHAEATVGRWLQAAPEAQIVTTSREILGLEEEICFELPPLDEGEGVRLFEDRARRVGARRALSEADRAEVARIVRRLDGLPLAIELAAARMALLSPGELAARLDARFELLRTSRRDVAPRHATLEQAIDWSFEMLAPWERAAFAQCAVFQGGFTLAAAEAVIDLSAFDGAPRVVDVLQALRQKSLVHRGTAAPGGPIDGRLDLYESLQEYARRRLEEAGGREAATRHARYYVEAAERWAARASGPNRREALGWLRDESSNLLRIARAPDEAPDLSLRAALALDALLSRVGPNPARLDVLDGVTAAAERAERPALRLRYLQARAEAKWRSYRLLDARADLERALSLARQGGDEHAEAEVLLALGDVAIYDLTSEEARRRDRATIEATQGRRDPAVIAVMRCCAYGSDGSGFEEAREAIRQVADPRTRALLLHSLAQRANNHTGELDRALEAGREAQALAREVDEPTLQEETRVFTAALGLVLDRAEGSAAGLEQTLSSSAGIGNRLWTSFACFILGMHWCLERRLDDARALLEKARALGAECGWSGTRYHWAYLGVVEAMRGRLDLAEQSFACVPGYSHATPWIRATIDLSVGVLEVARAAAAAARGQHDLARAHEARARRSAGALKDLREGPARLGALLLGPILERELRAYEDGRRAVGAPPPTSSHEDPTPPAPEADLELAPECMSFRTRRAGWVSLQRRHPLRRVLAAIVERHVEAPGEVVLASALVEAGWPGQRVLPGAAASRLHNAVAVLRGLGLRDMLITMEDGYRLDPAIVVRRVGAPRPLHERPGVDEPTPLQA